MIVPFQENPILDLGLAALCGTVTPRGDHSFLRMVVQKSASPGPKTTVSAIFCWLRLRMADWDIMSLNVSYMMVLLSS